MRRKATHRRLVRLLSASAPDPTTPIAPPRRQRALSPEEKHPDKQPDRTSRPEAPAGGRLLRSTCSGRRCRPNRLTASWTATRRPNQGCQRYRTPRNSVPWAFSSLVVQLPAAARRARRHPAGQPLPPRPRLFDETLPPIAYGSGDIVRKVDIGGLISFSNRQSKIGKAFRQQPLALRGQPKMGCSTSTIAPSVLGSSTSKSAARKPVDLWTSQARCPQPHRLHNNNKRSEMLLEENKNSVGDVPAHLSAMSPVQTLRQGGSRRACSRLLRRDLLGGGRAVGGRRREASRALAAITFFSFTWPKPRISSGTPAICTAIAWLSGRALSAARDRRLVLADQRALDLAFLRVAEDVEGGCRAGPSASASIRKAQHPGAVFRFCSSPVSGSRWRRAAARGGIEL